MLRLDPDDGGGGISAQPGFPTHRWLLQQAMTLRGAAWRAGQMWAGGTGMRARMGDLEIYIWKVGENPEVWVSGVTPEDLVSCAGP